MSNREAPIEEQDKLGAALLAADLLTREQLQRALEFRRESGGGLAPIVVKLGFLDEKTLVDFMAADQNLHVAELDELILPVDLIKRVPRKLIEKHLILPIRYREGVLTLATPDPYDFEALQEVQLALDSRVEIQLAPRSQIQRSINELFYSAKKEAPAPAPAPAGGPAVQDLAGALVPLLIEKGVITEQELRAKAREMGLILSDPRP